METKAVVGPVRAVQVSTALLNSSDDYTWLSVSTGRTIGVGLLSGVSSALIIFEGALHCAACLPQILY